MVLRNIKGRIVQLFERGREQYANVRRQTVPLVFPLGRAGGGIITGAKNIFQRATANPLGVGTIKAGVAGFGQRVLGRTLGGLGAIEGFNLAYSGATGTPYSPAFSPNKIKGVLGFALNPVAGVAGLFAGGGAAAIGKAIDTGKTFVDSRPAIPQFPDFEIGETILNFPSSGGMSGPSGAVAPIFNIQGPSASLERGGMDLQAMASMMGISLAALLVLLGIKRAAKKKKSKKRKR